MDIEKFTLLTELITNIEKLKDASEIIGMRRNQGIIEDNLGFKTREQIGKIIVQLEEKLNRLGTN